MNSEKIKKALRIAVNVGCGFEGDAEDAVSLLGLIEANEARIAELEGLVDELIEAGESMSLAVECENQIEANAYYSWKELVKDWKEREE